jgi:hypothetical protein
LVHKMHSLFLAIFDFSRDKQFHASSAYNLWSQHTVANYGTAFTWIFVFVLMVSHLWAFVVFVSGIVQIDTSFIQR